jgi:hypothetical protein
MKLTCQSCGFENEIEGSLGAGARRLFCRTCAARLNAGAARAGGYDGYAVGRRVLRAAPVWLLLCVAGFAAALFLFRWASRPLGDARDEEFRNEATNRRPAETPTREAARAHTPQTDAPAEADGGAKQPAAVAHEDSPKGPSDAGGADGAAPGGPSPEQEAESFSVQVGAFADLSDANEQVSRLRAAGFDGRVVEAEGSRRFRFQVRTGLFRTREEAALLSAQLRSRAVAADNVVVEPGGGGRK